MQLNGKKVAVLAADDYEDLEVWYPCRSSSLLQRDNKSARIIGNKDTAFTIILPIRRKTKIRKEWLKVVLQQ
jgi:hypothetical protein